jgi:phosphoadenosine phosphosulfate reductase
VPVDLAPADIETQNPDWASNTTMEEGAEYYVANRGNNTIVRMRQDGTIVAIREVRLSDGRPLGRAHLNGIASSPDGSKIWVTVTGLLPAHDEEGAVLELPAFAMRLIWRKNPKSPQLWQVSEEWTPERALNWGFQEFGEEIAIASGFGAEGMVLLDLASRLNPKIRVFVLDTEFLFPETYDLIDRVERRCGISVERVFPDLSPEVQARVHGPALWSRNPDKCCARRKVEPLRRKLARLRAWVTAIRRDQTAARAQAGRIEWDQRFQLVNINPIVDWSAERVWNYIKTHNLPYNVLHDRQYMSIGCTHYTRAVTPEEPPRAGRWAAFRKTECGLHAVEEHPDVLSRGADCSQGGGRESPCIFLLT